MPQEAQRPRPKRARKPKMPKTAALSIEELEAAREESEAALTPAPLPEGDAPSWAMLEPGADDIKCLLTCKQYCDAVTSIAHSKPRQFNLS